MHPDITRLAAEQGLVLAVRPSRTVLRLRAAAHSDVFSAVSESEEPDAPARRRLEAEAYLASLCVAHLPVGPIDRTLLTYRRVRSGSPTW